MENKNKFLSSSTRKSIVTFSVIISILTIALLMATIMIPTKKLTLCALGASGLVLFAGFVIGIVQINVFQDYKSQKKYLCSDGIFNLCVIVLVIITAMLFLTLQKTVAVDLRYFIFVFATAYAVWKAIVSYFAIKEKRNNLWLEIMLCLLWLFAGISVLITKFNYRTGLLLMSISCFLLLIIEVVYMLYSYIFKQPVYLETKEAEEILLKEQQERQARLNRFNALSGRTENVVVEPKQNEIIEEDVQTKLAKLNDLLAKNIITEEEYKEKRKQIIDKM